MGGSTVGNVAGDDIDGSMTTAAQPNREVNEEVQLEDQLVAGAVGRALTGSDFYWTGIASEQPAIEVARELVPVNGDALRCVASYVEAGRMALEDTGDRERAGVWVRQHGWRTWSPNEPPLRASRRKARLSQRVPALEALYRMLERRCADPECGEMAGAAHAPHREPRVSRSACCDGHAKLDEHYRVSVRDLLASTWRILEQDLDLHLAVNER
jgi:hypothetical protein